MLKANLRRVSGLAIALLVVVLPILAVHLWSKPVTSAASTAPARLSGLAMIDDSRAYIDVNPSSRGLADAPASATAAPLPTRDLTVDAPPTATLQPSNTPQPTKTLPPTATPTITSTPTPTRPTMPFTYTVKSGDTLWDLADDFNINVDSIVWANEIMEEDPDFLSIGQILLIPPVKGPIHTVVEGETLSDIATFYKSTVDTITGYAPNKLSAPYSLQVGQILMVPGGTKPSILRWVNTDKGTMAINAPVEAGTFAWPAAGYLTTYFSRYHLGIDIANNAGTPILASASGVVMWAGEKSGGWGNAVVLDNGDGYTTQYAHLRLVKVAVGQHVSVGQVIGEMGSTGYSTGPHLDFRIYYLGGGVNPFHYLP
jgi:murein DD-endopeptidase MepM/ murein hydrolase activator NlpD